MLSELVQSDITTLNVDAIVNAANSGLHRGGGVCGAIHAKAGRELADECATIGRCDVGDAVTTGAYNLQNARWIIHAVGPMYGQNAGRDADLLASTYRAVLLQCEGRGIESVALPCISTGIYGYPKEAAAEIAVQTIREWEGRLPLRVIFCCFQADDFAIYQALLGQ